MEYEAKRVAAPFQLKISDAAGVEDLINIAHLAATISQVPYSFIAFAGKGRWIVKAAYGGDFTDIPDSNPFCRHAAMHSGTVSIPDALKGDKFNVNNPLVTGNPNIRFFSAIPLNNSDGVRLGYLCVLDIRPRRLSKPQSRQLTLLAGQAEATLALRSEIMQLKSGEDNGRGVEQMSAIFYNAIDAVVVVDDKGTIVQWNPRAETIFGWSVTEAIGNNFHEIAIPKRYRHIYTSEINGYQKMQKGPHENKTIEIYAQHKNGTEFNIALGISPTIIKGSYVFINFVSDITDRITATKKLDKQKEFYENILNKLPADIVVFDADHKYMFVNPGGIKDETLRKFIIGKDDFEYFEYRKKDPAIAQLRRDQFLEVKRSGREIKWEDTLRDIEGNPITHLRRLFPVFDDAGLLAMVIGFGIDITDRKIMEEKQLALVKQLSVQNMQLVDFCNIVSHNLRGPLVNISMLVKFIEETKDEVEQKLLIENLNPVIENLSSTFNELVESIQIRQNLEIKSEQLAMSDCLQYTLEGLSVEIKETGAEIISNFEAAPFIIGPPKYLYSIFHNLVSNALKYHSPDRKLTLNVETRISGDNVILSFADNGLGIDLVKHRDNIFKIGKVFHRHPNSKGFGLFMTKTQVEAMNGNIWVKSVPDEGSTFYIELKIHRP